jgi:hypothetical protein
LGRENGYENGTFEAMAMARFYQLLKNLQSIGNVASAALIQGRRPEFLVLGWIM